MDYFNINCHNIIKKNLEETFFVYSMKFYTISCLLNDILIPFKNNEITCYEYTNFKIKDMRDAYLKNTNNFKSQMTITIAYYNSKFIVLDGYNRLKTIQELYEFENILNDLYYVIIIKPTSAANMHNLYCNRNFMAEYNAINLSLNFNSEPKYFPDDFYFNLL